VRSAWLPVRSALLVLLFAGCYDVDKLSASFDDSFADLSSNADLGGGPNDLSLSASPDLPDGAVVLWRAVASPVTAPLRALASDGNVLYAAGGSSTVVRIAADDGITVEAPGAGFNLRGATAAGGDVWLVGDDGSVLLRGASGWGYSAQSGDTLYGAFGLGAGDFLEVGSGGHFARNQTAEDTGATVALFAVWARSSTDVFAVGEGGVILHRGSDAGAPWTALTNNSTTDLHAVFGSGATVYAAGSSGTLLRSDDGTSWTAESAPSNADLFGLWASGNEAFAVGKNGVILHRTGGVWTLEHSGGPTLRAVLGRSGGDVWAVGDDGTLLRR
jgi:hypothetical protein